MFGSINQRVIKTKELVKTLQTDALPKAIQKALAYPDTKLTVIDAPGYTATPDDLMTAYQDPNNRSRTYQLTVLHSLADFKKKGHS